MAGHIQSASSLDWCTPPAVLNAVRVALGGVIHLDPCSNSASLVKATVEYSPPEHDGLVDTWDFPTVFVNPPFGACHVNQEDRAYLSAKQFRELSKVERTKYARTTIGDWVRRCADAHRDHGSEVISLMPATVDTKAWQQVVFKTAAAVFFPRGRIKFVLPSDEKRKNAPPMGCALVYWGEDSARFQVAMQRLGGTSLDLVRQRSPASDDFPNDTDRRLAHTERGFGEAGNVSLWAAAESPGIKSLEGHATARIVVNRKE
jgi:predicted RNA methylase